MARIRRAVNSSRYWVYEERKSPEIHDSRNTLTRRPQGIYNVFLERLTLAWEEANLTLREVSAHMGRAHSFLSKCETGERRVDAIELLQMAKLYRKSLDFFLE